MTSSISNLYYSLSEYKNTRQGFATNQDVSGQCEKVHGSLITHDFKLIDYSSLSWIGRIIYKLLGIIHTPESLARSISSTLENRLDHASTLEDTDLTNLKDIIDNLRDRYLLSHKHIAREGDPLPESVTDPVAKRIDEHYTRASQRITQILSTRAEARALKAADATPIEGYQEAPTLVFSDVAFQQSLKKAQRRSRKARIIEEQQQAEQEKAIRARDPSSPEYVSVMSPPEGRETGRISPPRREGGSPPPLAFPRNLSLRNIALDA